MMEKHIETTDFLQDNFFQSLKRKAGKDRKPMGFCLWKTSSIYHPGNIGICLGLLYD